MQYFSTIVPSANAIAAVNGVNQQVAALALGAGDWFVDGELWVGVTGGTPTINWIAASASLTSTGPLADPADNISGTVIEPNQPRQTGATVGWILPLNAMHLNVAAATTVYLNAIVNWTGAGSMSLYGKLTARGTAAGGLAASGNFVYLHLSDGSDEGYINMALAQFLAPTADGGSRLRIEQRAINVVESPSAILGAIT